MDLMPFMLQMSSISPSCASERERDCIVIPITLSPTELEETDGQTETDAAQEEEVGERRRDRYRTRE